MRLVSRDLLQRLVCDVIFARRIVEKFLMEVVGASAVRHRPTAAAWGFPGPPGLPFAKRPRPSRPFEPFGDESVMPILYDAIDIGNHYGQETSQR